MQEEVEKMNVEVEEIIKKLTILEKQTSSV
jgi:hypothetical protein